MEKVFVYDRTIRDGEHAHEIKIVIVQLKFEEGIAPRIQHYFYKPNGPTRSQIMETAIMACEAWYIEARKHELKTVKVYISGQPGRWIGNGPVPADRLA